ncbi:DUF1203 domain-containing protein [Flavobacterium sp. Fl-318]|uniref:DUF1203 domain-containing protein n=1 Tax=Flavobacterium cupriresistens TaxID=2893885 RepID=A0ABU4RGE0_9FLAO|nr:MULTISPECIES: DUF1203 domain-containing protein [unclassified Flavobacterium]MDX6191646.1 DUF1203 domain-containing protein [Flavobacterium sp. Fl-318]UFH41590.1 DUF1203 domain-containing protein [Flavobacterium sp. F-323]
MKNFKIIPLTTEYANKIKQTYKDDFGNQVYEEVATGKGPCRISLQPFDVGNDRRLVLKHSPFQIDNIFNQPGPIFIQKEEVEPYADIYNFPPAIKADKENFPLTLIGYNKGQKMIYAKLVGNADVDDLIAEIFESKKEIEFLHARNSEACCFICKIERL